MGATLALIIGLVIAVFGFLIMQDPTRLAWLDPGAEAYYQRTLVRGPVDRFQFHMLGLILSFFGWVLLSSGLHGILRIKTLESVSNGFLRLLWLSFISAFVFGVVYSIYQVIRGRGKDLLFGALEMRRRFIALGPLVSSLLLFCKCRGRRESSLLLTSVLSEPPSSFQ
jgi:hypothetical protein